MADGLIENSHRPDLDHMPIDFVCAVCGAYFTTDEDRKTHLEKEAHGQLHDETTEDEKRLAKKQEKLNESRSHGI